MWKLPSKHAAISFLVLLPLGVATLVAPAQATSDATWAKPVLVDPVLGPPTVVACPSASFCVLGDAQGAVLTGSGKRWSAPTFIDRGHAIVALACPSLTYCAAFDELGRTLAYDGSTWTEPANVPGADGVVGLSCASATYCLAVTSTSLVFSFDGSSWTNDGSIPET